MADETTVIIILKILEKASRFVQIGFINHLASQHETGSFTAGSTTLIKQRHASSARQLKEHNVIVLILNRLFCFEMRFGLHFFKNGRDRIIIVLINNTIF